MRATVRERLEALLADHGWHVAAGHSLRSAQGFYRIRHKWDDTIVCWETFAWSDDDPHRFTRHIVSYDTMTNCVRHGIRLRREGDGHIVWCEASPGPASGENRGVAP